MLIIQKHIKLSLALLIICNFFSCRKDSSILEEKEIINNKTLKHNYYIGELDDYKKVLFKLNDLNVNTSENNTTIGYVFAYDHFWNTVDSLIIKKTYKNSRTILSLQKYNHSKVYAELKKTGSDIILNYTSEIDNTYKKCKIRRNIEGYIQ